MTFITDARRRRRRSRLRRFSLPSRTRRLLRNAKEHPRVLTCWCIAGYTHTCGCHSATRRYAQYTEGSYTMGSPSTDPELELDLEGDACNGEPIIA